jgi:DNA-binding GntR family transcriptional regulator
MHKIVLHRARDEARRVLERMILSGELPGSTRLEEVRLSEQIGVSRTPVREALIALEREGLVRSRPQRGFFVVRPDAAMVREIYPILAALELAALELSGSALAAAAPELRALNDAMRRERKRARQYELDRAFHARLTEGCGNERLLELLRVERARAELIDGSHQRGLANLEGSCREHGQIVAALERGDLARASKVLAAHWRKGIDVVTRWMQER